MPVGVVCKGTDSYLFPILSVPAGRASSPTARAAEVHFGRRLPPLLSASQDTCLAAWKVLFIMLLALSSLGLALSTIVVTITLTEDEGKWMWFGGLLSGTIVMATALTLFLRSQDRKFKR